MLMLLVDREQAWEALRPIYVHLPLGGTFVFDLFWPFEVGQTLSDKPRGGLSS